MINKKLFGSVIWQQANHKQRPMIEQKITHERGAHFLDAFWDWDEKCV